MRPIVQMPAFAPGAVPGLQHLIVICNGTPHGDAAGHLAESIAAATGSTVRAMTVLAVPDPRTPWMNDPVLATLEAANDQLYRVASEPGLWRLTLLTGRWPERLLNVCAEEHAELIILPEGACDAVDVIARACDAVVACVDDTGDTEEGRVRLTAPPNERGRHLAHLVAAVAGGLGYGVGAIARDDARGDVRGDITPADAPPFSDRTAPA